MKDDNDKGRVKVLNVKNASKSIESDDEDEDYDPSREQESEDEEDRFKKYSSHQIDISQNQQLPFSKQKAVDEAFISLFGGGGVKDGDSPCTISGAIASYSNKRGTFNNDEECRRKRKKLRKRQDKKISKQKLIISDLFGGDIKLAQRLVTRTRNNWQNAATSTSHRKKKFDVKMEKHVIKEVKKFAGKEIIVERTISVLTGGSPAIAPTSEIVAPKSNLDSVLATMEDPVKISTVTKTSSDWDRFKETSGLTEEIEKKALGKDAFLLKKDFLQRVDQRQFVHEKSDRNLKRNNAK